MARVIPGCSMRTARSLPASQMLNGRAEGSLLVWSCLLTALGIKTVTVRSSPVSDGDRESQDGFRLAEWDALPDVCFIAACENDEIDERGPVWLRDGSMHKACTEHWEPIFRVLGEQATWEAEAGS